MIGDRLPARPLPFGADDFICAAWGDCAILRVLVQNKRTEAFRVEELHPDEQTLEMQTLLTISSTVAKSMKQAVKRLCCKKIPHFTQEG